MKKIKEYLQKVKEANREFAENKQELCSANLHIVKTANLIICFVMGFVLLLSLNVPSYYEMRKIYGIGFLILVGIFIIVEMFVKKANHILLYIYCLATIGFLIGIYLSV